MRFPLQQVKREVAKLRSDLNNQGSQPYVTPPTGPAVPIGPAGPVGPAGPPGPAVAVVRIQTSLQFGGL